MWNELLVFAPPAAAERSWRAKHGLLSTNLDIRREYLLSLRIVIFAGEIGILSRQANQFSF